MIPGPRVCLGDDLYVESDGAGLTLTCGVITMTLDAAQLKLFDAYLWLVVTDVDPQAAEEALDTGRAPE